MNDQTGLFGITENAKPKRAAPGTSARAILNKRIRAERAARDAIEWSPDASHAILIDAINYGIRSTPPATYTRERAIRAIDHLGGKSVDPAALRSALTAMPPPAAPVPQERLNGDSIREVLGFLRTADHARKMLASFLTTLIRDRLWTDYEMVAGRRRSFDTLRDMLLTKWPEGLDAGKDIGALREILSSFEEGRAALAVFEAEFADAEAPIAGETK